MRGWATGNSVLVLLWISGWLTSGCGGSDGKGGSDSGFPTDAAAVDLGPRQPDLAVDLGFPDSGPTEQDLQIEPADAGVDVQRPLPDLQFPDLGPLDLGLVGCQIDGCPGNQLCNPRGQCQEAGSCTGDLDCTGVRICHDATCQEPCHAPEDCPGSTWCHVPTGRCREVGGCQTSDSCLPGHVCVGEPGTCVDAPPDQCSEARPCPGGLLCGMWGLCDEPLVCQAEIDCLIGRFCDGTGQCVACRQDEDCAGTQTCQPDPLGLASCVEPVQCASDEDCLGERTCNDQGACVVGACPPDEVEPDEVPPHPVARAKQYERSLCGGETDHQEILVTAGSGLLVTARALGAGLDPALTLTEEATQTVIGSFDRPGMIEVAVLPLATIDTWITVAVRGRPADQGAYTLAFELVPGGICADDEGEQHGGDDTRARARRVEPGLLTGRLCPGDEDWLQLEVPPDGATLFARLDGSRMARAPSLALYLDAGAPVSELLEITRENLPGGPIWLKVAGGEGSYRLLTALVPPAVAVRCNAAPALQQGAPQVGTTAPPGLTTNRCGPAGAGAPDHPEALYLITVPNEVSLDLTLTAPSDPDTTLALRSICGEPASELACRQGEGSLQLPRVAPGRYHVVVEGGTPEAPSEFTLELTTGPAELPPTNDLCPQAKPIRLNQGNATVSGELARAMDDLPIRSCGTPAGLPEVFYSLQLDAPSLLTVTTTGTTSPWLTLLSSCAAPAELACAVPERALKVNDVPAGSYLIVASGVPTEGTDGTFTVKINRTDPAGPEQCLGAESIGTGREVMATTAGPSKYDLSSNGCTRGVTRGPDMPFRVHLEAGQQLVAQLEVEPEVDGSLYLVSDCENEEATCVAGIDEEGAGKAETLRYMAVEGGDYFLIVDSYDAGIGGLFTLTAAVDGECLRHRDCPEGARCVGFRCVRPQCAVDEDCPAEGSTCLDGQCIQPECRTDAACQHRGRFCVDHACAGPAGLGLGSGLLELPIPDDDLSGVVSVIEAPELGNLTGLVVQVEIEHGYQGDLQVTLVSPAGTSVRLHNQTGGAQPFGPRAYGFSREPDGPGELAELVGEASAGPWQLWVEDRSAGDTGVLQAWALYLQLAE